MITFFVVDQPMAAQRELTLGDDAAAHARARRIAAGDPARLLDGVGTVGAGRVTSLDKRRVAVFLETVTSAPMPSPLEVFVPVADRDRMLFAAEKCAELQVTAWRPVVYARSRSVSPRGEGDRFREKVIARMRAALEQSGGAWLPAVHREIEAPQAWATPLSVRQRFVMDAAGPRFGHTVQREGVGIAVGPEGGLETEELAAAEAAGWLRASLAATTLRFETAIVAAAAVVRGGATD